MSASLVGSEMCIRDRARAKDAQCADMLRQVGEQRALFEQQLAAMKAQMDCLLYTSDAADDM
eukprot:3072034-Alexandrium_andersonii.AAC.1